MRGDPVMVGWTYEFIVHLIYGKMMWDGEEYVFVIQFSSNDRNCLKQLDY